MRNIFLIFVCCLFGFVGIAQDCKEDRLALFDKLTCEAKLANKKIVIYLAYQGCPNCRNMEESTLSNEAVRRELGTNCVYLTLDAIRNFDGIELVGKYHIQYFPATIVFDKDGNKLALAENFLNVSGFLNLIQGSSR
jgi:thioredoxin-related protein